MDRRRLVRRSLISPSKALALSSIFLVPVILPYFLYFGTITHTDSREVLQFSNGQEEVSLSLLLPSSSLFLFSLFLPYFLYCTYFGTPRIRTPERCYSSAMDRRRLVRLSLIPSSSSLFSLSFFCHSLVLPLLWHITHTDYREVLQFSNGQEEVSLSLTHPLSISPFCLSFFCLSPVLPLLWHITHTDSREVLQFRNGQEEASLSLAHPLSISLSFLSLFILFFMFRISEVLILIRIRSTGLRTRIRILLFPSEAFFKYNKSQNRRNQGFS
jgi:hypothetical protein